MDGNNDLDPDEIPNKWTCRLGEWNSCTKAILIDDDVWQEPLPQWARV